MAPLETERVPIVCTLAPREMPGHLDEWQRVLAGVVDREAIDGGLRLTFRGVDASAIAELVATEQECCRFFAFALTFDARGLALEVRAPDDARQIVTELFGTVA
jgi:MerR family transcriptional regulator, copper efflux regulator